MKRLNYLIGLGLLVSLSAPAVDTSKLPPPSSRKDVTYDKDIKPLFEASCTKCHGADRPKAGLRLDSLQAVLKGSKEGKVIEVGKSDKSPLVIAISHLDPEMAMPPKKKQGRPGAPGGADAANPNQAPPQPLTAEQVGLVRAWIDAGAK
jgi:mono/diheme cytochrome c family protein